MSRLLPFSRVSPCALSAPKRLKVATSRVPTCVSVSSSAINTTQNSPVREWLVIIPDRKGVLERRIEIRPRHSPNFVRLHNEGYVSWAGPIFSQPCVKKPTHEDRPFMGSVMVVNDVSPDNIYHRLSSDPFITERIWDWENAKILPFKTVHRNPVVESSK